MAPIVSMSILFRFSLLTCSSSLISLILGSPLAYPTFRFKIVPVVFIGSSDVSLFSLIFICCWQKMESLFGCSMQWVFYRMQTWLNDLSNSASERRTVSILRRPPLTGMTTNDSWAWTMSPLRNVWGSHCWNLKFNSQREFRLGYLNFSLTLYRHFCPYSLRSIEPRCLRYAHMSKFHHRSPFHAGCREGPRLFGKRSLGLLPPLLESDNGSRCRGMENRMIFPQSWSSYPRYLLRIDGQSIHGPHSQLPTRSWMRRSQDLSIRRVDGDT